MMTLFQKYQLLALKKVNYISGKLLPLNFIKSIKPNNKINIDELTKEIKDAV